MQAKGVQPAESATVMTSSEQNQGEKNSEKAATGSRIGDLEWHCTYPNERRERNQVYSLLNISNSVNEQEERSLDVAVNGTGWEEAVQGWNKTAPFAYLQLQKRARKTRTSESVSGCLYCLDLMQIIDKGLEQSMKTIEQLRADYKVSPCPATDCIPEKQQTSFYLNTAVNSSTVDDSKKESYSGKLYSTQLSQAEKKKFSLNEAQASLSERRLFLMRESQLFQTEKKTVPIKEYSIAPPGKQKFLESLKSKDPKNHEPSISNLAGSEATTKSSLVLPPLKDAVLKNNLDFSSKTSKTIHSQASEKTFRAIAETISCTQVFKTKEQKREKGIDLIGDAVKEQLKMHAIASYVPNMLPKTSFISGAPDQYYWRCALLPDRKIAAMSNSIALRRNSHLSSMHFLHAKAAQGSRADENRDPGGRSRSHAGAQQGNEPKTQEIPLLSGLFPSLTEQGWGRATPFTCCKIPPKKPKQPRISKCVSYTSHQKSLAPKKKTPWIAHTERKQLNMDGKFMEGETVPGNKKMETCYIKPYNYIPMMTTTTTNTQAGRMKGKLDAIQTVLGGKTTLPIKEYEIKYPQPNILRCREIGLPKIIPTNPCKHLTCITLNALLVFRPDEEGIIKVQLEPPLENSEAVATTSTEQGGSRATGKAAHRNGTKKGKPKSEKKVGMNNTTVKKQIKKSCPTI